jgi:hypothetical protein
MAYSRWNVYVSMSFPSQKCQRHPNSFLVVPEAITFAIVLGYWGYWSYIKAKKRSAIESEGTQNPTSVKDHKLWLAFLNPLMLSRRKNIERLPGLEVVEPVNFSQIRRKNIERLPKVEVVETVNFSQIRRKPLRARVPRSNRESQGPEGNTSVSKMV